MCEIIQRPGVPDVHSQFPMPHGLAASMAGGNKQNLDFDVERSSCGPEHGANRGDRKIRNVGSPSIEPYCRAAASRQVSAEFVSCFDLMTLASSGCHHAGIRPRPRAFFRDSNSHDPVLLPASALQLCRSRYRAPSNCQAAWSRYAPTVKCSAVSFQSAHPILSWSVWSTDNSVRIRCLAAGVIGASPSGISCFFASSCRRYIH